MSTIGANIREKFNSLSPALQDEILKRNENLQTLQDLIQCLDRIVKAGEQ
jgi:hypothetical protein